MSDFADPASPAAPVRRRPGLVESVVCWTVWALLSTVAAVVAFASIFPLGFSGAYPDQAGDAGDVFSWALLTVFACLVTPIGMGIGHWRHWHIWYWPVLCTAVLARTLFLLQSL